jgi:hypothetical protein
VNESVVQYVVYGGNGRRRLGAFAAKIEAETFADNFERRCWSQGVAVPRSLIMEEAR